MEKLGAYIHIPFCNYKCHFCDFVTTANNYEKQVDYCKVLRQEIEWRIAAMPAKPIVKSIFYGGGTPGALDTKLFTEVHQVLLANIQLDDSAEVTLETTPETVTAEKAKLWKDLGVNRLSIGIESFDDQELSALGRQHTVQQAIAAIELASHAGFRNINCDLMYALPVQDCTGWQKSLNKFIETARQFPQITHLSAYALELNPSTPLAKTFPALHNDQTYEDDFAQQHQYLLDVLPEEGFRQYEISNFSKNGFQSIHNLNYWQQGNYLGFGVSAHRYLSPYRSSNWRSISRYMDDWLGEESKEFIDKSTNIKEAIMLGLRTIGGIHLKEFEHKFAFNLLNTHKVLITDLEKNGLLICENERLRLSSTGQTIANSVIAGFI